MVVSSARLAYGDCYSIMDQAIESGRGVRVKIEGETFELALGQARHLRLRMHKARSLDRDANMEIYFDPLHPMHGQSEYDRLVTRIKAEWPNVWLYVEIADERRYTVESLNEVDNGTEHDQRTMEQGRGEPDRPGNQPADLSRPEATGGPGRRSEAEEGETVGGHREGSANPEPKGDTKQTEVVLPKKNLVRRI